jgi:tRNA modification GTPase
VVRLSGDRAEAILRTLVPAWPEDATSHKLRIARIQAPDGALIDEALAVIMRGPKSYTGEDVVELQCHGGPIILRRALDAALEAGARMARPGEFTERAFLNGRLDLTQAEAVADLIEASSEAAHRLALEHLQGRLGQVISAQLERLVEAMVLIESAIDFSHEEHIYAIEYEAIDKRLRAVEQELERLIRRFDRGRRQREGVRVVVVGAVNAGKSTLFNTLYGDDRAIVTEIEGTTRDFLEEELDLGGVAVRLVDTAGLRVTEDRVEAIGIERSRDWAKRADLIVWVLDQSAPLDASARSSSSRTSRTSPRALRARMSNCSRSSTRSFPQRSVLLPENSAARSG